MPRLRAALLALLVASAAFLPQPGRAIPVPHPGPLRGGVRVAAAAPSRAPPPSAVAYPGLTTVACQHDTPQIACPAGFVIAVESVFYGRDVPLNSADPATCPAGPDATNGVTCQLSPHDTAATTLRFAQLCDGKQSCSGPTSEDILSLFPDPCYGTLKLTRVGYSCRSAAVDAPAAAVQPPANDSLRLARPATLAAPKCPKYSAGVLSANNAAGTWSARAGDGAVALKLAFVDLAIADLDKHVRDATGGAYTLDTVASLDITAVNVDFGKGTTTMVGKSNKGFTSVTVKALNILSDGSALDVYSSSPAADGHFGPDISVSAGSVYGTLELRQNGLTGLHPNVARNFIDQYVTVWSCGMECMYGDCGCDGITQNGANVCDLSHLGAFDWAQQFGLGGCDATKFQPACFADIGCQASNNGRCDGVQMDVQINDYYGAAMTARTQNDGSPWPWAKGWAMDRFTWPAFGDAKGKDNTYGTAKYQLGAMMDRQGKSSAAGTTWPMNGAGVISTADWTLKMNRHPAAAYMSAAKGIGASPDPNYSGWFGFMRQPPDNSRGNSWQHAVVAATCPAAADSPNGLWLLGGDVVFNPAATTAWTADPLIAQLAASCADEMVATGLFSDAQAFLADAAPAFSGSAAAAARAASVLADLRISRKAAGTLAVPFLSSDVITQAAGNSLAALQSIEAEIATAVQQGTTVAGAKAGLQGTLAMMDQVSAAATTEVQGDIAHVAELQKAFDAMNATYQQRYGDMGAAQATFKAGVQAALSAEIAEIVVEFIVDIATAVATEGAGAASMFSQLGGKISELTNVIKDVEKFAQLINTVAQMIYNLDSLINQLIPLVNQIEALPSAPNINLPPDAVAQASNSTNLASLTQSALSFQDLHDQATIYLGPAINQGIGGASDYAAALAGLANAGLDMVNLQIQLLGAQNKLVQSGVKLQSAIDQKARITSLINAIEADEQAVAAAVMELSLTQLERKMRAVDLVYQACAAFEYAHNAPCPAAANMPDPSSPAADFANAVRDALTGLDSVFQVSQCMCNVSWITTEPSFIGNLSANGRATLDLTNLSDDLLNYYFASTWDNVHTFQINLKPYGIKPSGFTPPGAIPTLQLLISPSGEYLNTFTQGGTRYVRPFLATPYTFAMAAQPSNGWKVTVPGGLTDDGAARFYVPTPYSRFDVRGDPNQPQDWDWTGVWGVQVEIWGYATHSSAGQNTGSGPICSSCSSASQAAMKAIGAR